MKRSMVKSTSDSCLYTKYKNNVMTNKVIHKFGVQTIKTKPTLKQFYTGSIIFSTTLLSLYDSGIYQNLEMRQVGQIIATCGYACAIAIQYVDGYNTQLDNWRNFEARYEDKTDPPNWSWHIIDIQKYNGELFFFIGCAMNTIYYNNTLACIMKIIGLYFFFQSSMRNKCILQYLSMFTSVVCGIFINIGMSNTPVILIESSTEWISVICEINSLKM